jgi:hypothetical protein
MSSIWLATIRQGRTRSSTICAGADVTAPRGRTGRATESTVAHSAVFRDMTDTPHRDSLGPAT